MVINLRTLGPLLLAAGLVLAGCNFPRTSDKISATPTLPPELSQLVEQTPLPNDDPAACLAGTWQVEDITPILAAVLPQDILEANQLTLTGTEGIFRYVFSSDGKVTGSAENFRVLAETKRGPFTIDVVATLNGQGTGNYSVDAAAQEIVFTNLVDKGFSMDVKAGGITVMKEDSSDLDFWFGGQTTARSRFECSGKTLVLNLNMGGQSIPVTLDRINP